MFNAKQSKKNESVLPYEKYHRENTLGPKADDSTPIWEKKLPHRGKYEQTTTEDQMESKWKNANKDAVLIEKVLNEAKGYVTHRSDAANISVPPINALVEKMRQNRMAEYETSKEPNWTQTYNEKKQQGSLPKWKKNAPQHDKMVLNNDPRRFESATSLPVHNNQKENDSARSNTTKIKPLIGNITTADIDRVVNQVKTGQTVDFDTAIVAILRQADEDKRELSPIEQKAVADLKIARTRSILK